MLKVAKIVICFSFVIANVVMLYIVLSTVIQNFMIIFGRTCYWIY